MQCCYNFSYDVSAHVTYNVMLRTRSLIFNQVISGYLGNIALTKSFSQSSISGIPQSIPMLVLTLNLILILHTRSPKTIPISIYTNSMTYSLCQLIKFLAYPLSTYPTLTIKITKNEKIIVQSVPVRTLIIIRYRKKIISYKSVLIHRCPTNR